MKHTIAVIAGDGIGTEVMPAAISCLDEIAQIHDLSLDWNHLDWGSDHFRATGRMLPVDGLETLSTHSAIFLGAVGVPDIPDVETLWGLLIPIRREFEQYINLRPVRTLPGVPSVLRDERPIDLVLVRENNEGEYSEVGGRAYRGLPQEAAMQQALFTRHGVSRAARFAAELATTRSGRVTSATKSNGIIHSMPFWDEIVAETLAEYPGLTLRSELIDALSASLVLHPWDYDVIVASNLFGDILSDLAGAVAGSIGLSPSANLNPEGRHPSMFEPVHGSAPDIAGKGIANPIGQIWSGAMMLNQLGAPRAAAHLEAAFEAALAAGVRTRDLGGTATTEQMTAEVISQIRALAARFSEPEVISGGTR
ncbi:tartrate dehydrogenase [Mycetocola tolaasinivorans]|uniref:D-malate dehydrogenase (decarboxylating) n=1 Tax=Mycetocola tolaasinivorans TaxID=76635 RepID=A0A3L7A6T6_9MICO|nr:tartrate dehydrogenase [Mycetocola tolaasinivorans]RLP75598.1 tartrate dehydrogenase [Mycetocola tolaasinivorans]